MRRSITPLASCPEYATKPLLMALGLWVVLTTRAGIGANRIERKGRATRLPARPDAARWGGATRPPRATRPAASPAVAALALTALAVRRCEDQGRRSPVVALLAFALLAQVSLVTSPWRIAVPLPAPRLAVPRLGASRLAVPWPAQWPKIRLPARLTALASARRPPARQVPASAPLQAAALVPDSAPAASAADATSAPAPAADGRAAWRPSDAALWPFPEQVEAWRPLVRQVLAEAWGEGRLEGDAAALDDDLVLALIQQESRGDPEALSRAGAIGLMQVMPFTFAEMIAGDRALTCAIDPAAMWEVTSNVRAGIRYLALAMQADEGNRYWALAAYNAGIEAVADWRDAGLYAVPPVGGYQETAAYAPTVLRNYLSRRPDVAMEVPDFMPPQHVPGALRLLQDLAARRPLAAPPFIPRCGA